MDTRWYAVLLTFVILVVGTAFGVVLGGLISPLQMEGNRTPELNAPLPTQPPTATQPPVYLRTTTQPPATTLPPAVTATPPVVILISPASNSNQSMTVAFNFTAISNHATSMAFTLFIDDQANFSGTIANGTFNVTTLSIADGLHSWSVSAAADGLLNGTSETSIFRVDGTVPVVTLVSPVNDSNLSATNITFDFKATDNSLNTTLSFTFYLDDAASFSGTMPIGFDEFATITGMQTGLHSWSVDVSDASGNTGTSETRFFRVQADDTAPVVTLVSPANDSNFSGHTVAFNFTATDDNSNTTLSFTFYLDGAANFSGTLANNTFNASNITGIQDGLHSWSVNVSDTAGNTGMSAMRFFRVNTTAQPVLSIASPQNTTYATTSIRLNVTANVAIDTWQYSLNGSGNITFPPNTTITAAEGANNIVVTANGTSGSRSTVTVYFTVDTTPPVVTVMSHPTNITYYNVSSVWVNVTLNENSNSVLAQLYNTTMDARNYTLTNTSGSWSYLLTNLTNGTYSVQIFARDQVGNMNSSAVVYFTVSP